MKKRAVKIAVFHGIGVLVFFLLIIFLFEYPFSPPATEPVAVVKTAPSKLEPTAPPKKFETCKFSVSDGDEIHYIELSDWGSQYYLLLICKDPFGTVKKRCTTMISLEDENLTSLVKTLQQLFAASVPEQDPSSPYLEFQTGKGKSCYCSVSELALLMFQEKVEKFLLPAAPTERFGPAYTERIPEEFSLHDINLVKNSGHTEIYGLSADQIDYTQSLPSGRGGDISETSSISWNKEEYQAAYSAICQMVRDGSLQLRFTNFWPAADLLPNDAAVFFVIDSNYPGFNGFCFAYDTNGTALKELLELADAAVKSQAERS